MKKRQSAYRGAELHSALLEVAVPPWRDDCRLVAQCPMRSHGRDAQPLSRRSALMCVQQMSQPVSKAGGLSEETASLASDQPLSAPCPISVQAENGITIKMAKTTRIPERRAPPVSPSDCGLRIWGFNLIPTHSAVSARVPSSAFRVQQDYQRTHFQKNDLPANKGDSTHCVSNCHENEPILLEFHMNGGRAAFVQISCAGQSDFRGSMLIELPGHSHHRGATVLIVSAMSAANPTENRGGVAELG